MKKCKECEKILEGRSDKLFCSEYCKSAYHYEKNRNKKATKFKQIDTQIKLNRSLLMKYNKAGKATIRKTVLLEEGFHPRYFTHYWKANNGNVYLFCYEFGFFAKRENDKDKYVLVQWQEFMEKQLEARSS